MSMNILKKTDKDQIESMKVTTGKAVTEFHFSKGKIDGVFVSASEIENTKGTASVLFMDGYSLISAHGEAKFGGCFSGRGKLDNKHGKEYIPAIDMKAGYSHVDIGDHSALKISFDKSGNLKDFEMFGPNKEGDLVHLATITNDGKISVGKGYEDLVYQGDNLPEIFGHPVEGEEIVRKENSLLKRLTKSSVTTRITQKENLDR